AMWRSVRKRAGVLLVVAVVGGVTAPRAGSPQGGAGFTAHNESGRSRTVNVTGFPVVADDNPFFLDLGTNGRRCVTCHHPSPKLRSPRRASRRASRPRRGPTPSSRPPTGPAPPPPP